MYMRRRYIEVMRFFEVKSEIVRLCLDVWDRARVTFQIHFRPRSNEEIDL